MKNENEEYKFSVRETDDYLYIALIGTESNAGSIGIIKHCFLLDYRINRAKKILIKKEDIFKKHFEKYEE